MNNWKQGSARNERKKQERRQKRELRKREVAPTKLSRKLLDRLDEAYSLIQSRDFAEAETLLKPLDRPGSGNVEVLEVLLFLYQTTRQHEECCDVAERLMKLNPRDPRAHILFAQESMFCGRTATAMVSYQAFVERWPENENAVRARNALEILVPEVENKIRVFGFPMEHAIAWTMIHERALGFVQRGDLRSSAAKCEELLALAPSFVPARNNLAIAYFQTGRMAEAVAVVEATRKLVPANRFAEATLTKLYFLTGRVQEAQEIAKHLVTDPPTDPDSLTVTLETLAYLGNDEDIYALATESVRNKVGDKRSLAMHHHYLAYAKCRLGDETGARSHWKKCLALFPSYSDARENLLDLETGGGHAPWADSFGKWIPSEQIDKAIQCMKSGDHERLLAEFPAFAVLIPALLDRGDPLGREVAAKLAMVGRNPPLIDGLMKFAFGSRGPDKLRFEVLTFLKKTNVLDVGPHRFYSNGKWTEVLVLDAEITPEPENLNYSPRVWEILDAGVVAQRAGEFDRAEAIYQNALTEDPTNATAIYNTCVIWMNRDGAQGRANAIERLRKLQRESPSYLMAPIALAQMAADDSDFKTAHGLLKSVFNARKLNATEAVSVFIAQIDVALLEKNPDAAQLAFEALLKIADPDDPRLDSLRHRIKLANSKNPLRKLLSSW